VNGNTARKSSKTWRGAFLAAPPAVKADEEGENLLRRRASSVDAPVTLVMGAFTGKAVAGLDRETKRSKAIRSCSI